MSKNIILLSMYHRHKLLDLFLYRYISLYLRLTYLNRIIFTSLLSLPALLFHERKHELFHIHAALIYTLFSLISAPNFVSSMTQGDFVYFFFRETAVEYINCGKVSHLLQLPGLKIGHKTVPYRQLRCFLFVESLYTLTASTSQ
jgi:hypothetical protein